MRCRSARRAWIFRSVGSSAAMLEKAPIALFRSFFFNHFSADWTIRSRVPDIGTEILTGRPEFPGARGPGRRNQGLGLAGSRHHSVVAQTVLRAGAVDRKRMAVLRGSVPFVVLEPVGRKL